MNEPGTRSRALANVFKGGGGISKRMIERLRNGKGPDLGRVRLLRGHFPLGIRDCLPDDRDLRCFTFLREPADRTLSHYFAIREGGRGYGLPPLPAEATLEDALERGYIHDNLHTRMLSGLLEPFGEVTEEMLEQAKRNLREELVFFGLTERFDESLVLAKQRLGFRSILYRSRGRVNTARPRGDEVPDELVRAAERCNRYDIELYRCAKELFESAPELGELEYEVELAALHAAMADGEIEVEAPVAAGFGGDEEAWRMLVQSRAVSQRLEWEGTRHRIPHVEATVQDQARESELMAARSKAKELEQEVERLRSGSEPKTSGLRARKKLEQEAELLKGARSKAKRLEQEVERFRGGSELKAARSRAMELEQEVERLREPRSKTKKLEQEVELLKGARLKAKRLEHEVESLKAASSRTKELEREVGRLEVAASRTEKLELQVERLTEMRSRNKELQQEVEDLRAASSRTKELEREVERLKTSSAKRTKELEQKVARLRAARSRKNKLEQKVERLRAAAAPPQPSDRPAPPEA